MIRYAIAPSLSEPDAIAHTLEAIYQYLDQEQVIAQRSKGEEGLFLTLVIFSPPQELCISHIFLNNLERFVKSAVQE